MASSIQDLVHTAYSFVRGQEANRSIAALTLDHLIQQQIDGIKGGDTRALLGAAGDVVGMRPSKLSILDSIEKSIDQVVQAVESAGDDPSKLDALGLLTAPPES